MTKVRIKYHGPKEGPLVSLTAATKILRLGKHSVKQLIKQGLLHAVAIPGKGKGKEPRIWIHRYSLDMFIGTKRER